MSELTITKDAFTGMVAIRLADDLTTQALVLTPAEYSQLQEAIRTYLPEEPDRFQERESANLKHLTIYNGYSLPTVIRPAFEERQQLIGPPFHFELHQVTRRPDGQITDTVVATL